MPDKYALLDLLYSMNCSRTFSAAVLGQVIRQEKVREGAPEEREGISTGVFTVGWLPTDDSRGLAGVQSPLSRWGWQRLKAGGVSVAGREKTFTR